MSDIPSSLAPFFQEYDLSSLDLERSAGTIIERTLQFGNREEIRWLFHAYPQQRIRDWVARWGKDALAEPHRTFWNLVLELSEAGWSFGELTTDFKHGLHGLEEKGRPRAPSRAE